MKATLNHFTMYEILISLQATYAQHIIHSFVSSCKRL